MTNGSVNARLEATLPLQVVGPQAQQQNITAVIDTGFSGALSLPRMTVAALSLPQLAPLKVTLGDGSQKMLSFYSADVFWEGQTKTIRVLCVEGSPLVGTALLKDCHLGVDFVDGGSVAVSLLP